MSCSEEGFVDECVEGDVIKFCYDLGDDVFECDCASLYGFVGENCTESSTQLVYYRSMRIVLLALATLFVAYDAKLIHKTWQFMQSSEEISKKIRESEVIKLLAIAILADLLYFLNVVFDVVAAFIPNSFEVLDLDDVGYTVPLNGTLTSFVHSLLFILVKALFLQVTSSWIRITRPFARRLHESPTWYYDFLGLFQRFVNFSSIMNVTLFIVLFSAGSLLVLYNYLGSAALFEFLVIVAARYCILRVLKESEQDSEAWTKAYNSIKFTSGVLLLACLGLFFFLITALIVVANFGPASPGNFQVAALMADLSWFAATVLKFTMSRYIKELLVFFLPEVALKAETIFSEDPESSKMEIVDSLETPSPNPLSQAPSQSNEGNPLSGAFTSNKHSAQMTPRGKQTFAAPGSFTPLLGSRMTAHVNHEKTRHETSINVSDESNALVSFEPDKQSKWKKFKKWFS